MMAARRVYYSGRVQGVGFRWNAKHLAAGFEVTGQARNLADGRVELCVRGPAEEVTEYLKVVRESGLAAHIETEVAEDWPGPYPKGGFAIDA